MNDQPIFEAEYVERRSRLTTFFRLILAIPHFIVFCGRGGSSPRFAVVAAWFALVFTGRYPQGLYDFQASLPAVRDGVLRLRRAADRRVPAVQRRHGPLPGPPRGAAAPAEYSRAKACFRLILAIPRSIIVYAMQIVYQLGAFIAWFAIVILGQPAQGPAGHDRPRRLLPAAGLRLLRAADRELAAVRRRPQRRSTRARTAARCRRRRRPRPPPIAPEAATSGDRRPLQRRPAEPVADAQVCAFARELPAPEPPQHARA